MLASNLIERVKDACTLRGPTYGCVYYYCYFGRSQDEAAPFLRSILSRLCRQLDEVPASLYDLYRQGDLPSTSSLLSVLEEVGRRFDRVFLLVDALDESQERANILRVVRDLATRTKLENFRVLATSREYGDIEDTMSDISTPISMQHRLLYKDIDTYVRSKLGQHPRTKRWPVEIRKMVTEELVERSGGM